MVVKKRFDRTGFASLLAGALLVTGLGVWIHTYFETKRYQSFVKRRQEALSQLDEVQGLYRRRGELLEQWSFALPRNKREEVPVLMSEVTGLDMKVPVELRRLEFVHERLTALEMQWDRNVHLKIRRPRELTNLTERIVRARRAYSQAAGALNALANSCRACRALKIPMFQVEEKSFQASR